MRSLGYRLCLACLLAVIPLLAVAQSDVGAVTGTVTDKSGAVVASADVALQDVTTNRVQSAKTNAVGQYTFSRVEPGRYRLTVKAPGFRATTVTEFKVSVGKTANANVNLEVGQVTETVEVQGGVATDLQTLDASVGNVLDQNSLANMPTLTRDATRLMLLQPSAIPAFGASGAGDENVGGQIAGARGDQNTFLVDGGDATSNTDANGAYNTSFTGGDVRAAIPTPVESLEEFRVATNNATIGFGRGAGGEVQMVTRRGSNAFHGAAYFYGQWNNTNANSWERNHAGQVNPALRDGRFGGRIGGPIFKDKTFFFAHYEGRHFLRGDTVTRWAPGANIRSGQLGYVTTSGTKKFINPATQACDGTPAAPPNTCDPRGLGLNPTILAIWNQMPLPNQTSGGDGANFFNFTVGVPRTQNEEFGVFRLDHQITQKWHATASYRYGVTEQTTLNQVRLNSDGTGQSLSARPLQPRYAVFGLTGQLTQHMTNDLHFDYLRHWWQWGTARAQPQVSGLGGAVQLVNENVTSGVVPVNVDTQQARQRNWNGKDYNLIDNLSWLKGNHLFNFGGRIGWQRLVHSRDDKVTYALSDPVYYSLFQSGHKNIAGINVPSDAASATAFSTAYVAMLGLIEEADQLRVRDSNLGVLPAGTRINPHTSEKNWEVHYVDTWHLRPSLTVTYGLGWSVQTPPYEENGQQTMLIDTTTGKILVPRQYYAAKAAAALQGQAYNPILGVVPIKSTGRNYPFDVDYTNLSPRAALAWNPSITSGPLASLFGDKKAVIRAGWSRVYDRVVGVDIVMTPALALGFSDVANCLAPLTDGTCAGTSTPLSGFRIGTDGNSITIPAPPPLTSPIIPGSNRGVPGANAPRSVRDYRIDPRRQVGSADVLDFTIQRELPRNMFIEVGFIGRIARDLFQKIDGVNQVPYMYTMGGQSFAAAYDAAQTALIAGGTPAPQPFFEAALGGVGSAYCTPSPSCTAAVVSKLGASIAARDVYSVFSALDSSWVSGRFLPNQQMSGSDFTTSSGRSRYAAMFVTFRKRISHGLQFDANYTLSKSMDNVGYNQDTTNAAIDAYDLDRSYGPSTFDRRHVFNAYATYELPFGRAKSWANHGVLERVLGGWSTSYIFNIASGLPVLFYNSNSGLEFGDGSQFLDNTGMVPVKGTSISSSRHDTITIGPNGYGADSGAGAFNGGYPNAFANPDAAAAAFRLPLFSDARAGYYSGFRGLRRWTFDVGVAKTTRITERTSVRFDMQMINAFNHPLLFNPNGYTSADANTDLASPADFGVLNTQYNQPRYIQWGLRFDF